ncbi:PLDc N-terminal domain-containing protein [Gordonia sp. L191]|uniref:PLDc N-terminal domain-containing protein n=1 Tax=Gordonia sp. L191 TaxID=2982699 RepID=UPI0024BFE79D|nr:PLDc N-terminal domain-containing protein [Gordonia sp. L191]WHU46344.1 PLDc N-terminal domain-containing protein [Gordonia sp. L191]
MWSSFWEFTWSMVVIFAFVAYLLVLFYILSDLFRDHQLSGWAKAAWILFLIVVPYLTSLVYLIARGRGMSRRTIAAQQQMQDPTNDYIRSVAGKSAAEQIADAKALLDAGTITEAEFGR